MDDKNTKIKITETGEIPKNSSVLIGFHSSPFSFWKKVNCEKSKKKSPSGEKKNLNF